MKILDEDHEGNLKVPCSNMSASVEDSGLSCNYYKVTVMYPYDTDKAPYIAECGEVAEALGLTGYESNIFKELWRQARARQGLMKKGNTPVRGAEKILWNAKRIHAIATRYQEKSDA